MNPSTANTDPEMTGPKAARQAAEMLEALAEPTRLRIVALLATGEMNVTELATALAVDIVRISSHLQVLRRAKVVTNEKLGRFVAYTLNPEIVTTAGKVTKIECGWCRVTVPRGKA